MSLLSLFCLCLGHKPICLVIDRCNDLLLGGQPDSSSSDFFIPNFTAYFCVFLGVSYTYCPHCLRLVKATGLKGCVGIKNVKASNKNVSSW